MVMTDLQSSDVEPAQERGGSSPAWELLRVGNLVGHESRVFSTAFSPRCVPCSTMTPTAKQHRRMIPVSCREPWKVATGSEDGTARIWDVTKQCQLLALSGHEEQAVFCVAWSPDGRLLVSPLHVAATRECFVEAFRAVTLARRTGPRCATLPFALPISSFSAWSTYLGTCRS
jgi:WD40 repeat protein